VRNDFETSSEILLLTSRVVMNDSLETGSQMPVVRQAISEGYSVVILNQNLTEVLVDGITCRVRVGETLHDVTNISTFVVVYIVLYCIVFSFLLEETLLTESN